MFRLLLPVLLSVSPVYSEPVVGNAFAQLSGAAEQPESLSGGQWSDGSTPPSPGEATEGYTGFQKGFALTFVAVEWVPNYIAAKVPVAGKPLGGILGLVLMPVAIVAGLVGGLISLLIGLF